MLKIQSAMLVLFFSTTVAEATLYDVAPIAHTTKTKTTPKVLISGAAPRAATSVSFEFDSWDEEFDSSNDMPTFDLASLAGMPAGSAVTVIGLGWDLDLEVQGVSWFSESVIKIGDDLATPTFFLHPGQGDDFGATTPMTYSSGGIMNFAANSLPDLVLADGVVELELYELLDDETDAIDARYLAGSALTFDIQMPALLGDFDGDGIFGCGDIDALSAEVAAGSNDTEFDVTADGFVDVDDLDQWLLIAGENNIGVGRPYLYGDANLSGVVDAVDFSIWSMHKFTADTDWCHGNFNGNATIDAVDFAIWSQNKFQSSVPEPGTSSTVVMTLALILSISSRRNRTPMV